jgi:hypothetical protein
LARSTKAKYSINISHGAKHHIGITVKKIRQSKGDNPFRKTFSLPLPMAKTASKNLLATIP